mmetsp:Transcript_43885/g.71636  ORF Transcript_43885/g.71636 Transcript_43885/m.71636 type:complete len:200 (-) Transcript_43885:792-1391(-)
MWRARCCPWWTWPTCCCSSGRKSSRPGSSPTTTCASSAGGTRTRARSAWRTGCCSSRTAGAPWTTRTPPASSTACSRPSWTLPRARPSSTCGWTTHASAKIAAARTSCGTWATSPPPSGARPTAWSSPSSCPRRTTTTRARWSRRRTWWTTSTARGASWRPWPACSRARACTAASRWGMQLLSRPLTGRRAQPPCLAFS